VIPAGEEEIVPEKIAELTLEHGDDLFVTVEV